MGHDYDHVGRPPPSATEAVQPRLAPGKRTLTERVMVPTAAATEPGASLGGSAPARSAASAAVSANGDRRPMLEGLFGPPRAATGPRTEGLAEVHTAAARGTATPASRLPHADQIQRAFGRHDISVIQGHVGPEAAASARAMGARAYATGQHVVLDDGADLRTVAHEAAHVVQQRGGVQLFGGVGASGDAYEQHADEVAARVVQGDTASDLLDRFAAPRSAAPSPRPTAGEPVQKMMLNPAEKAARLERKQQRARLGQPHDEDLQPTQGGASMAPAAEGSGMPGSLARGDRAHGEKELDREKGLDPQDRLHGEKELDREKGLDAQERSNGENPPADPGAQFGPISDELRRRLGQTRTYQPKVNFLVHDIAASMWQREKAFSTLSEQFEDYAKIASFCPEGACLESSKQPIDADVISALLAHARELRILHQDMVWKVIPAYQKLLATIATAGILDKKGFGRETEGWGSTARDEHRAALAAHYRETLQQLNELERGIEHAFVALSDPMVGWVLHDLAVLEKARSQMVKAHRQGEAAEKANRKNQRAERKEKSRAKRNEEQRTVWQAPVGRGDDGSSRKHIIQIRGQETEPNIQLTAGMKAKVEEFIALDGQEFSGRLRDLMNERFGGFECPRHYTIRISDGERIEFNVKPDGDVWVLTIVNIGKPTYNH